MSTESIFVSYSSKDRPFAVSFTEELKKLGANVWIDQLGIGLGENWDNAIEEALEKSDTVMLILSPTSVESPNVQDEVSIAISTDKKFVPILIKECDLPMRWKRRQYADLLNNPDKAIGDILNFLGLQATATSNLKNVLSLIGVSEAPPKPQEQTTEHITKTNTENLEDLLISEAEIDRAIIMHQKAIKKNWKLIAALAFSSISLLVVLYLIKSDFSLSYEWLVGGGWKTIVGCLMLNLLSIKPYGSNTKRSKNIELLDLLKIKRERLTRVINKLTEKEINDFNNEFDKYIAV
ncbi:toll/interleukin-1 receptor domain-containing protein [Lacinutrix iliipiscaria]|uniref:Toll/interleukin-1 receptor domain-containing protein n=1 Tax=Lacinutrix iliipiscaria TaxID=1230532 RepID=A0ABW5WPK4_9FLAO